jgi:hypothetical protein
MKHDEDPERGDEAMNAKQAITTALLALAVTATTAARASASDLWLHVKVHDGKEDSHVTVNLPLSMVEKASSLIPADAHHSGKIKVNNKDMDVAELRQLWDEVQKQPDATYVTVDEKDSKVRIAKRGSYLYINAKDRTGHKGGHEDVEVKIPIEVVSALLSGRGDEMNFGAAIQALARRGEGELVTVNGDDETVRIWVDAASETR